MAHGALPASCLAKTLLPGPNCWEACGMDILLHLCETCRSDFRFFRPLLVSVLFVRLDQRDELWASDLRCLAAIAEPSSEHVLALLMRYFAAPEKWCRQLVISALGTLVNRGGSLPVIHAVSAIFDELDVHGRCSVIRLFAKASKRGEVSALANIVSALEDGNAEVRQVTVSTIAELVGHNCAEQLTSIVDRLIAFLDHEHLQVRDAAITSLTSVSVVANAAVISLLAYRLHSNEPSIRHIALQALQLITAGDREKMDWLLPHLANADAEVRYGILQTLDDGIHRIYMRDAAAAVWPLLEDSDDRVRGRAVQVLGKLRETRPNKI